MKRFNKDLAEWYSSWGCTTEFSWSYDHRGNKYLDIAAIDLAVHRRAPIGGETLGDMLEKADLGSVAP